MNHAFASDNSAPLCPEALRAIEGVNLGAASSYGNDPATERATAAVRGLFETDCAVYFVTTGTAANALALSAVCRSYHAIVCHESAHLQTDECGAPEFFTGGARVLPLKGGHGKLDPRAVEALVEQRRGDVHSSKPAALSLTQSTEAGTVYTCEEVAALADSCRRLGLRLHMDGARFANAVASLGEPPRAITWDVGVDVLSFGGTKNGMGLAEAVVFFDRSLAEDFEYRRKQAGQLTSKMRYLSAPWPKLLEEGHWLRYARQANAAAARLAAGLQGLAGIRVRHPVEANAVFVDLPEDVHTVLSREWAYYFFEGSGHRFMCSWQTTAEDVQALVADIRRLLGNAPAEEPFESGRGPGVE
jgi:threonine aldolase